ncbi:MAG: metal-dependent transcriptional regulator [Candidatus Diapherotrites archaeon]|nr:metal-dependent transcriptional regulator [Candidatus Diapherotrites archaeon]
MPSRNEQDYLRYIYELQSKNNRGVKVGEIAKELGISKPSVSEMLSKFKKAGLVEFKNYGPVSLTKRGIRQARIVLRKHRILEVFFARLLGLKKSFHDEAHEIEHAISEVASDRLEKLLKNPKECPDGREIPAKQAKVMTLNSAPLNRQLRVLFSRIERKEEQSRINALGLVHGEKISVTKRISNGPLIIKVKKSEIVLGKNISSLIFVEADK